MLDPDFVRAQFPAFAELSRGPSLARSRDRFAFFDNAGGSYVCGQVIDRLTRFYTERKMQPYGPAEPTRLGGEEMDEARARLSAMLGVDADELTFGPSTTANTYVMAQAFADALPPGAAIVVTDQDHEANSGPWRRLAARGIEIREWAMDADGHLDPETLEPLLAGAHLVCFPHCSNVVAEINDVAGIVARIHAAGAVACVDGVSYAPHGLPDVGASGADIYLFSGYKTYGPHQGLMVVRRALAERLPVQGHAFNAHLLPMKFAPAGPDHAQVAACAGIADYIDALADHLGAGGGPSTRAAARAAAVHDAMRAREELLLAPLMAFLGGRNDLRVLGPADPARRAPTVAMACAQSGATLAAALAERGIIAGGGDFYAVRPLRALGIDPRHGVLRVSFTHYTTEAEVARLIAALAEVL